MIGDQTGQCIEITDADKGIRTEFGRIHAEIGPVRLIDDHPTDIRGLFIGIHYAGFIVNRTAGEERLVHMVRSDKFQSPRSIEGLTFLIEVAADHNQGDPGKGGQRIDDLNGIGQDRQTVVGQLFGNIIRRGGGIQEDGIAILDDSFTDRGDLLLLRRVRRAAQGNINLIGCSALDICSAMNAAHEALLLKCQKVTPYGLVRHIEILH